MTGATLDAARAASLALLRHNLTPQGILAASPTDAARARRYTRIFGRDAAICVLAMGDSGDAELERGAVASIESLGALQADNGQIAKFVDPDGRDADFWYLGCIDATLWWVIAADHLRRLAPACPTRAGWTPRIRRALDWLLAQEHPHFRLLQQNEASDWADIMPRSGYVLYTNALWYRVKRRFGLAGDDTTREHFNHLFHPTRRDLPRYRRARLLQHYALRDRPDPALYLSYVNFASSGHEGDVFGNLLAVLCGLADAPRARAVVATIAEAGAADPLPIRTVLHPLTRDDPSWRPYMVRHRQNLPHQYHNGGIWPFIGGFWVMALARVGRDADAADALSALAGANARDGWRFTEWFDGRTLRAAGMAGQSWNAAMFLLAERAVRGPRDTPGPFDELPPARGQRPQTALAG